MKTSNDKVLSTIMDEKQVSLFREYLNDRLVRHNENVDHQSRRGNFESKAICKTERAECACILSKFERILIGKED